MLLLCDIQNNSWEENHTALRVGPCYKRIGTTISSQFPRGKL